MLDMFLVQLMFLKRRIIYNIYIYIYSISYHIIKGGKGGSILMNIILYIYIYIYYIYYRYIIYMLISMFSISFSIHITYPTTSPSRHAEIFNFLSLIHPFAM